MLWLGFVDTNITLKKHGRSNDIMHYSKYNGVSVDEFLQEVYRQDETVLTYRDADALRHMIEGHFEGVRDDKIDERDDIISELEDEISELSCDQTYLQDEISELKQILKDNNIEYREGEEEN